LAQSGHQYLRCEGALSGVERTTAGRQLRLRLRRNDLLKILCPDWVGKKRAGVNNGVNNSKLEVTVHFPEHGAANGTGPNQQIIGGSEQARHGRKLLDHSAKHWVSGQP